MRYNILSYIRFHRWQLICFCIVGLATFVLNFFLVWLLYEKAGLDYRIAVPCAYFITVVAPLCAKPFVHLLAERWCCVP